MTDEWAERARRRFARMAAEELRTVQGRGKIRAVDMEATRARLRARGERIREHDHDQRASGSPHMGLLPLTEINPETNRLRYIRPEPEDPAVDLPALFDRNLAELAPPAEREAAAYEVLARTLAAELLTVEETLPFRVRVAYRITRELARIKGLAEPDETLAEALTPDRDCRDKWTIPTKLLAVEARDQGILSILSDARGVSLEGQLTTFPFNGEDPQLVGQGGLALRPPEIPWRWRDPETHDVVESYDEARDEMLGHWIELIDALSARLCLDSTHEGRMGLLGLNFAETTRALWPGRLQILMWEEELIARTLEKLVKTSLTQTRTWLAEEHGLTRREALTMVKLATRLASQQAGADLEDLRSVMVLRLEDFIHRSKNALDLTQEIKGLKQLAMVQGLTRTDPEDAISAFAGIVKRLDAKEGPRGLPGPVVG